jgi:hypothetical protein
LSLHGLPILTAIAGIVDFNMKEEIQALDLWRRRAISEFVHPHSLKANIWPFSISASLFPRAILMYNLNIMILCSLNRLKSIFYPFKKLKTILSIYFCTAWE